MTWFGRDRAITRRTFLAGSAAVALSATVPARARATTASSSIKGVVELFTSQGCSSCPPADLALAEFAADPDILALGYHVDYWDYLGWRDTLANAENTKRQHAYARALGNRSVYTPQAIVNGRTDHNGARKAEITQTIDQMSGGDRGLWVPVNVSMGDDRLTVAVEAGAKPAGADTILSIAYFRAQSPVVIDRGENAGRTFTYANAVTAMQTLAMWNGDAMQIDLPKSKINQKDADGCAVLLQAMVKDGAPGPILGAANLTGLKNG